MDMIVFLNIKPEDHENFRMALDKLNLEEKRPMTNAEKQKAYRERKKATGSNVAVTESNAVAEEEKEEVSPLSPLPFSPLTPYPIPPISPLPEEREEDIFSGTVEIVTKEPGKRGELKSFGAYVKLSDKEFLALEEKFGYEDAMHKIQAMNDYIGEDPKRVRTYQTRNHYLTLLNWARRDAERKQQAQPKKRESWTEIAEKLSQEMALG